MNYRLAVLTHGRSETLPATLASFQEYVRPEPVETLVYFDGDIHTELVPRDGLGDVGLTSSLGASQGFCGASGRLWDLAANGDMGGGQNASHVFWLEHDFEFREHVDLRDLARVLDEEPDVAQMSLMRDAANEAERAAGGLYELRADEYTRKVTAIEDFDPGFRPGFYPSLQAFVWMEHLSYFTTTPNLMRREFMQKTPWPIYSSECEGKFGLDLVAAGYRFGVWGNGTPWVSHVGVRSGFGY